MAAPNVIDCSRLFCQDVIQTARGAKQIPLVLTDGGAVLWQPLGALTPLWEPSAYNEPEATRVNISFAPTQEVLEELRVFDEWSVDTLSSESARLFVTKLDREDVKRRYQSALKVQEQTGATSFRCKLNLAGRSAVECWDTFRNLRSPPESWTNCAVNPRILLKGYWCMGKE